jgi:hypothetical protein
VVGEEVDAASLGLGPEALLQIAEELRDGGL